MAAAAAAVPLSHSGGRAAPDTPPTLRGRTLRPRTGGNGRVAPSPRRAVSGQRLAAGARSRKRSPSPSLIDSSSSSASPRSVSKRERITAHSSRSPGPRDPPPPPSDRLIPAWIFLREAAVVVGLIFGGCCTNVYTLERIVRWVSLFLLLVVVAAAAAAAVPSELPW